MAADSATAELKNMVQNLSDLVIQVSKDVNQMLDSLEGRMSALETRLERGITDVFKWMVGMMVPAWISILIITQFIKV